MNYLENQFLHPTKKTVLLAALLWLLGAVLLGFATEGFHKGTAGILFLLFFGLAAVSLLASRYQRSKMH